MNDETVVVVPARLDAAVRRLVIEACEHARVDPVFWGEGEAVAPPTNPSLVVAALPAGERAIPDDVASLATVVFRGLPLLLLSPEPLVRNSVSLHGGRVTLLGHPLSREKISARIRTALVGRPSGDGAGGMGDVCVREHRGREWWAGALSRDPGKAQRSPEAGELFPLVGKLGRQGMAGLLPLDVNNPMAPASLQQAALGFVTSGADDSGPATVEGAVAADAAGVWFSPATLQWTFYLPRPDTEAWLYSPLRLPNLSRLAAAGRGSWRTFAAASGDVAVLAAGTGGLFTGLPEDGGLEHLAEGGGPAVLDDLEARFSRRDNPGAALIVELR